MKLLRNTFILLAISMLLFSCGSGDKKKYMPNITGKPGEVLLVLDKAEWESELGTLLRESLTEDYPLLPQREPMFNIFNTVPSSFQSYPVYSTHRNIFRVQISESIDSAKVVYQEDVWASPQIVITLYARDNEGAKKVFESQRQVIIAALETAERNRVIRNAKKYPEVMLRELVLNQYGGSPYFPQGYTLKKKSDDFIWISYETTYVNQGIFIYSYPYEGEMLDNSSVVAKRNEVMKAQVPGMRDGSFMTTSTVFTPTYKWIQYKGRTFGELRGLWEVENDYMGGPFVSHTYLDTQRRRVIVVEGFVYAPKYDKRNYLRHVESILYSFEWK